MASRACASSSLSATWWPANGRFRLRHEQARRPGRQQRVQQECGSAGQLARAQILLGDSRRQRVGAVELAHGCVRRSRARFEPGAVHVPGLRLRQSDQRSAAAAAANLGLHHTRARDQLRHAHAEWRFPHQKGDADGGIGGSKARRGAPARARRASPSRPRKPWLPTDPPLLRRRWWSPARTCG